jgi:hypothetical protein
MSGKLADVDGLNQAQEKAILALLAEPSLTRAAKACGTTERTLYRWLREETAFIRAYRRARREAFSQAIGLTQRYAPVAVTTLVRIMTDETAPHTSKVQAATTLLRFGRDGVELDDLLDRVEALEAAAEVQERRAA